MEFSVGLSVKEQSDKPKGTTKLLYGMGDVGNATVKSFAWIAISFVFYDTMNTLTSVPYYTLTAELTDDYGERASMAAFRLLLDLCR